MHLIPAALCTEGAFIPGPPLPRPNHASYPTSSQHVQRHQEKSRLRRIAGATRVQVYRPAQTHREAIFTHTEIQPLSTWNLLDTCTDRA